jgi:hypothetical protein
MRETEFLGADTIRGVNSVSNACDDCDAPNFERAWRRSMCGKTYGRCSPVCPLLNVARVVDKVRRVRDRIQRSVRLCSNFLRRIY